MTKYFGFDVINKFRSNTPKGFYDPIKLHSGIDINCPVGTPLSLPIKTKVVQFLVQNEMGKTLYLEDENGYTSVYAHLSEVFVKVGEEVEAGKGFAKTGNTGKATTGAHLHFEVICKSPEALLEMMTRKLGSIIGYNIDPIRYLDRINAPKQEDLGPMEWTIKHGIFEPDAKSDEPVTKGECAVYMQRLAKQVLKWVGSKQ